MMTKNMINVINKKTIQATVLFVFSFISVTFINADEKVKKEADKTSGARTKGLGFIAYKKYPQYYKAKKEKRTLNYLKSFYPEVEIITEDVDIFLPKNYQKLKNYKRIWIPAWGVLFTPKMYGGMQRFINEGGLLISNETLPIIDKNEDYKYTQKLDPFFPKKQGGNPILGIQGANSAYYAEIKVVKETPMTSGLEINKWEPVTNCAGRYVKSAPSAIVAVLAKGKTKHKNDAEMPFLTYKQQGKGASIYLATIGGGDLTKKLVTKILSEATLNWLCEQ